MRKLFDYTYTWTYAWKGEHPDVDAPTILKYHFSMHERSKLAEAKYFYSRMRETQGQSTQFNYNLSAFLSAARSVLQYAHKKARSTPGGQDWYSSQIKASSVLIFFKGKRDINIHMRPVAPLMIFRVNIEDSIAVSDALDIFIRDLKEGINRQSSVELTEPKVPQPAKQRQPDTKKISYRFSDWTGTEDVMALCQTYIYELQQLVEEGQKLGFITPQQTP